MNYLILILFVSFNVLYSSASAQTDSAEQHTLLDDSPWASARAAAMSRAISPIADGMDAPFYNPAGIGGIQADKSRPFLHELHFPYVSGSVNQDSIGLNKDIAEAHDLNDPSVIEQILKARENQRQYGRVSVAPYLTFSRFSFGYSYDVQMAAVSPDTTGDQIEVDSRAMSGPSLGFSFADEGRNFSFGLHMSYITLTETKGTFDFATLNDSELRKQAFKDNENTYVGAPIHAGLFWRVAKKWSPTLALVFRNAGNTKFRNNEEQGEDLTMDEDLTLGFGLSPRLKKWGYLNFTLEGHKLSDNNTSTKKKLRTGLEFQVGKQKGNKADFSIRTGYSDAGLSYGAGFNLGMIALNAASFVEDIGVNNKRVIERRYVVNFAVNVADQ